MGYKSFIFPLYSVEMNLPTFYITNIVVIAKALSNLIMDPLDNAMKNIDHWWRVTIMTIAVGLSFLAFIFNDTIVWAIIVLVIVTVFNKLAITSEDMVWPREVRTKGLEEKPVGKAMNMIIHTIKSFRDAILSFIKALSGSYINVILGLICSLGGVAFALITKNTAMKKDSGKSS